MAAVLSGRSSCNRTLRAWNAGIPDLGPAFRTVRELVLRLAASFESWSVQDWGHRVQNAAVGGETHRQFVVDAQILMLP